MEINSSKRVKYAAALNKSQGGKEYPTYNKKEGRVTGLVTSYVGTAFSKHVAERKMEGTGRRGRRRWMVRDQRKYVLRV